MSFDEDTTEAYERRITRCKSCRTRIIWLVTPNGKNMPVDADTVEPEHDRYIAGTHTAHFVTCPNAKQHRRK